MTLRFVAIMVCAAAVGAGVGSVVAATDAPGLTTDTADSTDRLTPAPVPTLEPTATASSPTPTRPPVVSGAGGGPTGGSA